MYTSIHLHHDPWSLAPSSDLKRATCGNGTLITVYTNGSFSVCEFRCHRWDCERCAGERRQQIVDKIVKRSPSWYAVTIDQRDYAAICKRIKRAGTVYCSIGVGEPLMLTDEPVIDGAKIIGGDELKSLIDMKLRNCPHVYRQRRFKHSHGLFPPEPPPSLVHILRRVVVADKVDGVIDKLKRDGFDFTGGRYARLDESESDFARFLMDPDASDYLVRLWSEDMDKRGREVGCPN